MRALICTKCGMPKTFGCFCALPVAPPVRPKFLKLATRG